MINTGQVTMYAAAILAHHGRSRQLFFEPLTLYATSEAEAMVCALGAAKDRWPVLEGYTNHEARIKAVIVAGHAEPKDLSYGPHVLTFSPVIDVEGGLTVWTE